MKKFILCKILGAHEWTCKASEGISPSLPDDATVEQTMISFGEFAAMYCKRCGRESEFSIQLKKDIAEKYGS